MPRGLARWLLLASAAAVWGLACQPDPDVEPDVCRNPKPAQAIIGKGDQVTGFTELSETDPVVVTLGPQRLNMFQISVKVPGFESPPAGTEMGNLAVAVYLDGHVVGTLTTLPQPVRVDKDTVAFLGLNAVMDANDASTYKGRKVEVEVSLMDGCGRWIRARRSVTLKV